jgi:hypothetical protein
MRARASISMVFVASIKHARLHAAGKVAALVAA